jgi:hypothetical protein
MPELLEMGSPKEEAAPPIVPRPRRWLAPLFFLVGIGLLPWTVYMVATLPARHVQPNYYDVAWGGFDIVLAALLVASGVGLLRRRLWVQSTATAAATMLVCDAWFDILSSRPGTERVLAILLALVAELPSAVICLLIARHVEEAAERAQQYALAARRIRPRRRRRAEDAHLAPKASRSPASRARLHRRSG